MMILNRLFPFLPYLKEHPYGWTPSQVKRKRLKMWCFFFMGWIGPALMPVVLISLLLFIFDFSNQSKTTMIFAAAIISFFALAHCLKDARNRISNMKEYFNHSGMFHEYFDLIKIHRQAISAISNSLKSGRGISLFLREFDLEVNNSRSFEFPDLRTGENRMAYMYHRVQGSYDLEKLLLRKLKLPLLTLANIDDRIGQPLIVPEAYAYRLFANNSNWKMMISHLISFAEEIHIHVERLNPGIVWEINEIISQDKVGITHIYTHSDLSKVELFSEFDNILSFTDPI